jgi:hypothetical protein
MTLSDRPPLVMRPRMVRSPVEICFSSLVEWKAVTLDDFLYINIYNWLDEYEQLSGKFILSKKPCSEAKAADGGLP